MERPVLRNEMKSIVFLPVTELETDTHVH